MTIGERIAILRKHRGFTQKTLAERLCVSDKAVSKWERGVSCPDIAQLPLLSEVLCVSADVLLTGHERQSSEDVPAISLERYLMGELGFVVSDLHPQGERAVLLMDSPDEEEAAHGCALTGKRGEQVGRILFATDTPVGWKLLREGGALGVTYVSNVPLCNLSAAVSPLVGELEGLRLGRYTLHRWLLLEFSGKLERLLQNDRVRILAMTREFNQKYLFSALAHATPRVLALLRERMENGSLKLLFVGMPSTWTDNKNSQKYDFSALYDFLKTK